MPRVIRPDDFSFYDIPDNVLAQHPAAVPAPPVLTAKDLFELSKLEYEKGAQRYNDVYTAAWTNFSYMAIVAGAILTFGGDRFLPELSALLACLPLLFWWLASFEPLNRYGDKVIDRLGRIETSLNTRYNLADNDRLSHFSEFRSREGEEAAGLTCKVFRWTIVILISGGLLLLALKVFRIYPHSDETTILIIVLMLAILIAWLLNDRYSCGRGWGNIFSQFLRVRFAVRCFAFILLIVVTCLGYKIIKEHKPLLAQKAPEVKVIPVDFNKNLGIKLDGITAKEAQELIEKAERQKTAP